MISGRCYCGATALTSEVQAQTVTYCHCADCKRVTGAPVTAFAAFGRDDVVMTGDRISHVSHSKGVERWFCAACGSPLKATYAYLPDQCYVPLGLLDQAPEMPPSLHCFAGEAMPWLIIEDDLQRVTDSGSDILQQATDA